jgi:PKD domain/Calx-beta domain
MRPVVVFVVLLSVVCSPGVRLHAQSCIAPDRLDGLSVTGTTCEALDDGWNRWRCDPGDTLTFTPLLRFGSTPATCPTTVDWEFGDGTTLTSSDASVTHTYAGTGWYFGKLFARILGQGEDRFSLFIAAGVIGFESTDTVYVDEGHSAFIPVVRTGNLSRPGTIDYQISGQIPPLSGTLAFGAGEARKDLVVETVDDAVSDGQDDFARVDLSNPTGDWVLESSATRVNVIVRDNDVAAVHQCAQTELQADERAGKVTFELTRSQNTSGTTTGWMIISNWPDALHGSLLVTFAPGETTRFADLQWENNSVYHGTREWNFTCGGSGPGASPSLSHGTLTITDDEAYPTLVTPPSIEVTETDTPQQLAIPLTFVPPFGYFVDVNAVLEHETSSDDDLKLLPLRFPYDQIELEIDGDNLPEPDESFYLRISGPVQKRISLTIRDDDRPPFPFTFDRDSYEFDEALGGSVVVQRTGSSSSPVQLLLIIEPTIAGAAVETIPVLLASGESSKEVLLGLDDAYFTGTRTVTLKLELDGFVGATANVVVKDNEAMPSLSVGDGSVQEGNPGQFPSLEFLVTLTAPVGGSLELTLSPSHVSTDAADFRAVPQPVTIPRGEVKATAVFFVTGDSAHEADETFNVTITSCCDALATVARQTGTATIVNDDAAPPPPTETLYRLALGATPVQEADRWLSIPVHRSGLVSAATHAILKLTASDERVFAPGTVSFAPNETENVVQFYINDFWYSGNTIVKVELFDGDRLLETQSVTILDDEQKPATFARGGTGREGNATNAAPLVFTVNPPSRKPIILGLHARSGTAKYGEDFPGFDKTVEIPPGRNEYEVLIPIHNDRLREATETFSVDITVDGNPISSRTVWIADDDTAYVVSEPNVLRGTLTTITVYFAIPAPSKDAVLFLADPATFEGPLSVPVPAGASSVSFQVLTKRSGPYSFAIEPPSFLPPARIVTDMNIFDEQMVTLEPAALELAPGTSARFVVTTWPGRPGFTTQWPDWRIAVIERAPDLDGYPSFLVYGLAPGQTEIVVKLPASAGGATARLPIIVKEPEKPGRRRAAGH